MNFKHFDVPTLQFAINRVICIFGNTDLNYFTDKSIQSICGEHRVSLEMLIALSSCTSLVENNYDCSKFSLVLLAYRNVATLRLEEPEIIVLHQHIPHR